MKKKTKAAILSMLLSEGVISVFANGCFFVNKSLNKNQKKEIKQSGFKCKLTTDQAIINGDHIDLTYGSMKIQSTVRPVMKVVVSSINDRTSL